MWPRAAPQPTAGRHTAGTAENEAERINKQCTETWETPQERLDPSEVERQKIKEAGSQRGETGESRSIRYQTRK